MDTRGCVHCAGEICTMGYKLCWQSRRPYSIMSASMPSMTRHDTAHREPHATRRLRIYVTFTLCHGDTTMNFPAPELTTVALDLLLCDSGILPRVRLDPEQQELYESLYREEGLSALPPVAVFFDGHSYWLADGFHRVYAARGLTQHERKSLEMPVALYRGSRRDARVFACGANAKHGKPLSSADKRLAIHRLLEDSGTGQWSNRRLARYVGVDDHTVASVRNEFASAEIPQMQPGMGLGQT